MSRAQRLVKRHGGAGPAGKPPISRPVLAGLADSDGKLEVGPDLSDRAGVDSTHRHQRRCHHCEPGAILRAPNPGRGNILARRSSASDSSRR